MNLDILRNINIITSKHKLNPKFQSILDKNPGVCSLIHDATDFIEGDDMKLKIRVLMDGHTARPACGMCDNVTNYDYRNSVFKQYCSHNCAWKDPNNVKRVKETKKLRYGDENFNNRTQASITNMARYGVEIPAKDPTIAAKIRATKVKNGTDDVAAAKSAITNLRRYGATTFAGSMVDPHLRKLFDSYDYLYNEYIINNKTIDQLVDSHNTSTYFVRANLQKHNITKSQRFSEVLDDLRKQYADVDPSTILTNRSWVEDIVKEYNLSKSELAHILHTTLPYIHTITEGSNISFNKSATSVAESEILAFIKVIYSETVISNTRNVIAPQELDIYIPDLNIAIEYNGVCWHSELAGKNSRYHINKTDMCNKLGVRLVQIFSSEWVYNNDICKSRIRNLLGLSSRIYARQCNIVELTVKEKGDFLSANHIQGSCGSRYNYGLSHNGEIVACMTFGKSRFSKNYEYELLRYSNRMGCGVVGGASRLFKHFLKSQHPKSIITYSDKRWNTGGLYGQLGFTYSHTSKPNYFYFNIQGDTNILMSRNVFQKHKLKDKLATFDSTMTEWENMQVNNYDRIWDCGNDVWGWEQT